MTKTRRLVVEEREDGSRHVLSLPIISWQLLGAPKPSPTEGEMRDEIGLLLADQGLGPQPDLIYDDDGELHLRWFDERGAEKLAERLVQALAPEFRRARRVRRGAKARAREAQKRPPAGQAPKRKTKDVRPRLVEIEQERDGRWVVSPSDASDRLVIPASVLVRVRRHAAEVDARQPGYESFGALVVDDGGRVLRYARLANLARKPGHVRIASARQLQRRSDGHALLSCHSHPRAAAAPSPRDIESAIRYGWSLFAIHGVDGLRLWAPDGDGDCDCREVAFDAP